MSDIICPHCSKAFKVDETGYAQILKQVHDKEFEASLSNRIVQLEKEKASELQLAQKDSLNTLQKITADKDAEIERLKAQIREKDISTKSTIEKEVREIEKERDKLLNDLKNAQLEKQNSENLLRDKYKTQIRDRDDAIERLKDMKAKLSTKMVGETLEQHCEIEFNKLRLRSV